MRYSLTVLNATSGLLVLFSLGAIVFDYKNLSAGEGWGLLFMGVFVVLGVGAFLVDLILQIFIRDKETLNLVGTILALLATIFLIFS